MERRNHKRQNEVYSQSQRREDAIRKLREERLKQKTTNRHQLLQPDPQKPPNHLQEPESLAEIFNSSLELSDNRQNCEMDDEIGLMQPQWMVEFPYDLTQNWLVLTRPEGRRCMIIATKGRTTSYLKNGGILHTFKSRLPGGSCQRMDGPSILDGIFHEADQTYYISDLMCWKGIYLNDCEAQLRLTWIQHKLNECEPFEEEFKIEALEHWCCNEKGLLKALYDYVPFTRDGICVLLKEGHYSKGPTELALFWKDLTCSRYLIETDMTGKQTEDQFVILKLGEDGGLYTGDHPETRFSDLSHCLMDNLNNKELIKADKLIRFKLHCGNGDSTMMEDDMFQLEFVGFIKNRRRSADLMSKIIFQRRAREGNVRSDDLMRFVRQTPSNDVIQY